MKKQNEPRPLSRFQIFLLNSRYNGAPYYGDRLPAYKWTFPRETWFQKRLEKIRKEQ